MEPVMTPYKKMYSVIISTKSPSSCVTNFSASLANLTVHLPQSHDSSCYVSRRILAPHPLRLQKHADLRAHDFASPPVEWHRPKFAHCTCPLKLGTLWTYSLYTRTCLRRRWNRTSRLSSRSLESRVLFLQSVSFVHRSVYRQEHRHHSDNVKHIVFMLHIMFRVSLFSVSPVSPQSLIFAHRSFTLTRFFRKVTSTKGDCFLCVPSSNIDVPDVFFDLCGHQQVASDGSTQAFYTKWPIC